MSAPHHTDVVGDVVNTVVAAITVVETIALFIALSRRLNLNFARLVFPLSKMLIVAGVTGVSLWLPMRILDRFVFDTTRTIPLLALTAITSLIGLFTYVFLSYLFRVEEIKGFLALARRVAAWPSFLKAPVTSEALIPPTDQP